VLRLWLVLFAAWVLISVAVAQHGSSPEIERPFTASPSALEGSNLPFQPIGPSDLVRITVYDSPELSRSFRVDSKGYLNLPLLSQPVPAMGLMPDAIREEIAAALRTQHLFVDPIVDVSVVEYRSRAVTIAGAVKTPVTIQEFGSTRLLDALNDAGGLLPEAGPEIVIERASGGSQRVSVRQLFDGRHPELNLAIMGGDQIRVPEAERVFVVGDVKQPGSFPYQDMQDTTVLKALAMTGGLDSFSRGKAYIYRAEPGSDRKREIEIPLRRILERKSEDVRLAANDILYIPTNRGMKASASVLNHVTGMGSTAVSAAIWSSH
jgi:polysaccharide export outer membrane protein